MSRATIRNGTLRVIIHKLTTCVKYLTEMNDLSCSESPLIWKIPAIKSKEALQKMLRLHGVGDSVLTALPAKLSQNTERDEQVISAESRMETGLRFFHFGCSM